MGELTNEEIRANCRAYLAEVAEKDARTKTLGWLLDLLEEQPMFDVVAFDVGGHPSQCGSYRGDYAALGISARPEQTMVRQLLGTLRRVNGKRFDGYKGGSYLMHRETRLYVATWGTTEGSRRIVGVRWERDTQTVVLTTEEA